MTCHKFSKNVSIALIFGHAIYVLLWLLLPHYGKLIGSFDPDSNSRIPRSSCKCDIAIGNSVLTAIQNISAQSTCSDEATVFGRNQSVLTFSMYIKYGRGWTETKPRFFDGILENLKLMKEIYPGWVMRVYTNLSLTPEVCEIVCSDNLLFFCNTRQLPIFGDVQHMDPRTWRFLVLNDPTVYIFASRDLDSRLSQREKDAVDFWMGSDFPFHAMRDHPAQRSKVMAGMWGANNEKVGGDIAGDIQWRFLNAKRLHYNGSDQVLTENIIYVPHQNKILIHDSYSCEELNDSVPFPTERQDIRSHVGGRYHKRSVVRTCPVACRPEYGQSWEYC